jgi:hypothetical protein
MFNGDLGESAVYVYIEALGEASQGRISRQRRAAANAKAAPGALRRLLDLHDRNLRSGDETDGESSGNRSIARMKSVSGTFTRH